MRRSIRGVVAIVIPTVVLLSACVPVAPRPTTEPTEKTVRITALAGLSLDQAQRLFHGDPRIAYDLSAPILNIPASGSLTTEHDWTVVAGCSAEKNGSGSALGVIKTGAATPAILKHAREGAYQHLLVECR
jgi:hypothetical protein